MVFGLAIGAFGVLPRLEYNALSNLAGGYPAGVLSDQNWWSVGDWALLLEPSPWYAGLIVLALALVAPLIAFKRFAISYFGSLALGALILTSQGPTPLHSALYLLPYFERLHPHRPDRVILIFYLCTALLAGAALSRLEERARRAKPLSLALLFILAVLLLATTSTLFPPKPEGEDLYPLHLTEGLTIHSFSLVLLSLAVLLVAAYALLSASLLAWRNLAFALLALVVFADLFVADRTAVAEQDLTWWGWTV